MRYIVIIEQENNSYGASVPDLPGCIAVGETEAEVLELIQEAIQFHLEDLAESGQPVLHLSPKSVFVEVQLAA